MQQVWFNLIHDLTLATLGVSSPTWRNSKRRDGRQLSQRFDEHFCAKRLYEKGDAADFCSLPFDRFIDICAHEYYGDVESTLWKVPREFHTAILAKANVDNQAHRGGRYGRIKELFGGNIEFRVIPECSQQTAQSAEDAEIIVNYRNDITLRLHEWTGLTAI
jgi:hypothetical protein